METIMQPKPGQFYYHKKHNPKKGITDYAYEIIGIGKHSEDESLLVIYRPLYGEGGFWLRPLDMFMETVEKEGEQVPRFSLITDPEIISQLQAIKQERDLAAAQV